MKQIIHITILSLVTCISSCFSQEVISPWKGSVQAHFGTISVYSTYDINYETNDIYRLGKYHFFHAFVGVGGWSSSYVEKNKGLQSNLGVIYLLGKERHFLELSSAMVFHFDKSLKSNGIVYVGALNRSFIGYRLQSKNNRFLCKIGFGWKEVLQFSIGYQL